MGVMPASPTQSDHVRRRPSPRFSPIAVFGTLVLVAGAVAFGVLGPRMGQRGMRIRGIPATSLRDAVLDDVLGSGPGVASTDVVHARGLVEPDPETVAAVAMRHFGEVFGPAVEPAVLTESGFELAGSRRLELLGVPAIRLDYRSTEPGWKAILFEIADPLAFVHFDDLGRQQPLLPGTRVQETVRLGPTGGPGEPPPIGLVMLAVDGRATVIVTFDPEVADRIAEEIEPGEVSNPDSVNDVAATILEGPIGPMSRS